MLTSLEISELLGAEPHNILSKSAYMDIVFVAKYPMAKKEIFKKKLTNNLFDEIVTDLYEWAQASDPPDPPILHPPRQH